MWNKDPNENASMSHLFKWIEVKLETEIQLERKKVNKKQSIEKAKVQNILRNDIVR